MSEKPAIVFDLEAGPETDKKLRMVMPKFESSSVKDFDCISTPFDPSTVKYGQTKDTEKRAAKLKLDQDKYKTRQDAAKKAVETGEEKAFDEFVEGAALHAYTGCILAMGYFGEAGSRIDGRTEPQIIQQFFNVFRKAAEENRQIIGHNSFYYDLRFICQRARILQIKIPFNLRKLGLPWWNRWHLCFVDTMLTWSEGDTKDRISLDILAKLLGVGQKPSDVSGATFHKFWNGTPEQKKQAKQYLANDLDMTRQCAVRLGVMKGN